MNADNNFKEFWIQKDKEEIIEAYLECVKDCESLYDRNTEAIKYVEKIQTFNSFRDWVQKLNVIVHILEGD